jgi:hypothetical protein
MAAIAVARGQNSIAYVNGPSFQVPDLIPQPVDLNADGVPDVQFWLFGPICYGSPEGFAGYCLWPYLFSGSASTGFLRDDDPYAYGLAQPHGAWIGSDAPLGGSWSGPDAYAGLATQWWSRSGQIIGDQRAYSGWDGSLGTLGVGYLGIRVVAADGLHYCWIRVRLPSPERTPEGDIIESSMVVVDWAYETRPNMPIAAGVIEPNGDSIQLMAEFGNAGTKGTFILTGNTLRAELTLTGSFDSAEIHGPAEAHSEAKPLWSFGPPLVSRNGYTAFFGDATLSHGQVMQLLRGALYVSVDGGTMLGFIVVPDAEDRGKERH